VIKILSSVFLAALSLALAGCATPTGSPPLPNKNNEVVAVVTGWVPLGTSLAQAQTTMQQHGFTCKVLPADNSPAPTALTASITWPPGDFLHTTWDLTFTVQDDKVTALNVAITSLGPAGNYSPSKHGIGVGANAGQPN
jgi:hypothetical protein